MKREQWLLLITVLIFSGLAVSYLRPGRLPPVTGEKIPSLEAKPPSPQSVPEEVPVQKLPEAEVKSDRVDEQTPWARNPFLIERDMAKGGEPQTRETVVKAIIMGEPKSVATIDGKTVVVGEKIGEETVSEIRPDAVVLEINGRRRILKVSEPSISIEVKEGKK